jgi:hypothetical protein
MYTIEQSINFYDRDTLFQNFQVIGKEHLILKRQHVFRFIKAWQMAFWNFKISYCISYMHQVLHPEQKSLIHNTYNSRRDVEMTDIQARYYFKGTENRLKPSSIEHYFIRLDNSAEWVDYYCTKDHTGDLPLPPEFEVKRSQ